MDTPAQALRPYDAHTHLDFPQVEPALLPAADRCIAGADPAHWERVVATARAQRCHFALGIHPWFDAEPTLLDRIAAYDPDGLGEIGLDRLRTHPNQRKLARLQLERADRPVVLHCVRAHDELLGLLQQTGVQTGLAHAWTGSLQQAQRFVDQGLHLSFGPAVLGSQKIQAAARWCPDERLLVETDGEDNAGLARLDEVLACVASLRQTEVGTLVAQTVANATTLFPQEPLMLPDALRAQVDDEVVGWVRTKGKVAFAEADGKVRSASIWLVVCPTRCFLVAASGADRFRVAGAGALAKGWTWDAVQIGRWSSPLKAGTRSKVEKLLAKCTHEGETLEPEVEARGRGQVAAGVQIPAWIEAEVPETEDGVWLFAYETAATQPFPGREGTPEQRPLWIAVSDRGLWLAAPGGFSARVERIEPAGRGLRARVKVDGRALPGAVVDRKQDDLLRLVAVEGEARWGVAVRNALLDGRGELALGLLREAWERDRYQACWRWLGALAMANGDSERALIAAFRDPDPLQGLEDWSLALPSLVLPNAPFASVELPALPDGWPALPTPRAVLATAAVLQGRVAEAWTFWQETPDALAAKAAHEPAPQAWTAAALAWRPLEAAHGAEALDRALALGAHEHYRAALWAHEDGRDPTPYWQAAFPAEPPEGFEQPRAAWEALATLAATEAPGVASVAWRELGDPPLLWQAVAVLRAEGRLEEAIEVLTRLTEVEEDRWRALHGLAEVQVEREEPEAAREALKELVATAFLDREALDAALVVGETLGEALLDVDILVRWRHLRAQLDNGRAPAPEPLSLDATELDGLHPGGVGWLERTRQRLDTAQPPERGQLVRGLEKVEPLNWPDLTERIDHLADRLGTPVPDIFLFRGEGAWGMSAWPTDPPLLLVGHDHLQEGPQGLDAAGQAFALAVELAHLAAGHPLLAFDGGIVGTSRSVYDTFGKYAGAAEAFVDVVSLLPGIDQIAKIQTVMRISRRVFAARSAIDKANSLAQSGLEWFRDPGSTAVGRSFDGAALQFRMQADRAAWLVTGDLRAAIEAILASDPEAAKLRPMFREQGVLPLLEATDGGHKLRIAGLLAYVAAR